jgi:hypothetical protein
LDEKEVDQIYNTGSPLLTNFAARLTTRYFSDKERNVDRYSTEGENMIDPVRIGFIRSHLVDRNGGPLTDKQWNECKYFIFQRFRFQMKKENLVIIIKFFIKKYRIIFKINNQQIKKM